MHCFVLFFKKVHSYRTTLKSSILLPILSPSAAICYKQEKIHACEDKKNKAEELFSFVSLMPGCY